MGIKKFIRAAIEALDISDFEIKGKKKSLKSLLKKLKQRRVELLKEIKNPSQKPLKELQDELELLNLHIKKGKEKLNELKES
jgi:chromosome segregation ATPase